MIPKITRKEYNVIVEQRDIKDPQNISKEELLNTLSRYDSKDKVNKVCGKLSKIGLKKIAKIENISKNELTQVRKFLEKSMNELKKIARVRNIRNIEKLTKEELIITLQKVVSKNVILKNFLVIIIILTMILMMIKCKVK